MPYDDVPQNPWTRPGFITAALVVAIVLVLGVILAVRVAGRDDPEPVPTNAGEPTTQTSEPEPAEAGGDPSVCGLDQVEPEGTVTRAPNAEWTFLGISAVPSSPSAGPGTISPAGMRSCFARTPEGAVFMAVNAAVQGSTPEVQQEWTEYVLASGSGRDVILGEPQPNPSASSRLAIEGFRLMEYDGATALVDIAVRVTSGADSILGSVITPLVWEGGDWKIVVSATGDLLYEMAVIPDVAGYVSWSASNA